MKLKRKNSARLKQFAFFNASWPRHLFPGSRHVVRRQRAGLRGYAQQNMAASYDQAQTYERDQMTVNQDNTPSCFGQLDIVFPEGEDGLRMTPDSCFHCSYKTACLCCAMQQSDGFKVREKMVDNAYEAGMLSFFQRWSRKKYFNRSGRHSKTHLFSRRKS